MRTLVAGAFVLAIFVGASSTAFAAPECSKGKVWNEDAKECQKECRKNWSWSSETQRCQKGSSRFYNFEGTLIDGIARKPTALNIFGRRAPKFKHLLELKKSMTPYLLETAKEFVFK